MTTDPIAGAVGVWLLCVCGVYARPHPVQMGQLKGFR